MASPSIEQLTDNQRECLRLVLTHHSSKEIAAILRISPSAVDKRLERAVQILGATSRFDAARTLHDREGTAWERLPSDAIDVPDALLVTSSGGQIEPSGFVRPFLGLPSGDREVGQARNQLSKFQRSFAIVALMVLLAIATMAMINMAATLGSLLRSIGIAHPPGR